MPGASLLHVSFPVTMGATSYLFTSNLISFWFNTWQFETLLTILFSYFFIFFKVLCLGQEDLLEKEVATHSSILPGESHYRGAWQATYSPWSHKELTQLSNYVHTLP